MKKMSILFTLLTLASCGKSDRSANPNANPNGEITVKKGISAEVKSFIKKDIHPGEQFLAVCDEEGVDQLNKKNTRKLIYTFEVTRQRNRFQKGKFIVKERIFSENGRRINLEFPNISEKMKFESNYIVKDDFKLLGDKNKVEGFIFNDYGSNRNEQIYIDSYTNLNRNTKRSCVDKI